MQQNLVSTICMDCHESHEIRQICYDQKNLLYAIQGFQGLPFYSTLSYRTEYPVITMRPILLHAMHIQSIIPAHVQ